MSLVKRALESLLYGGRRFATEAEVRNFIVDMIRRYGYLPLADEQDLKYLVPVASDLGDIMGLLKDAALAVLNVLKFDDVELNRVLDLCRWCIKIAAKSEKADFKEIAISASEALSIATTIETVTRGVKSEEDLDEIVIRALRAGRFERGFTMRLKGFLIFTGFLASIPESKALKNPSLRGFRKAYSPTILATLVDLLLNYASTDVLQQLVEFHVELRRQVIGELLDEDRDLQGLVKELQPQLEDFVINAFGKLDDDTKRTLVRRLRAEAALTAVHLYRYGFKTKGVLRVLEDGFVKGLLTL